MTCRYAGCTEPVAAPGMSRCEAHRLRWLPDKPAEPEPRLPEWRKRDLSRDETGGWAA